MTSGLTLREKFPGLRAYPTYRLEVISVLTGTVRDLTIAVRNLTIAQSFGLKAGTVKAVLEYGKDTPVGQAMTEVENKDVVVVTQVGPTDPEIWRGFVDNPHATIDGALVRMELDARDETENVMCKQCDLVLTATETVSNVAKGLLAANFPSLPTAIEDSTFLVEPITFRQVSMHRILTYLAFVSGERFYVDLGTFRWFKPSSSRRITAMMTTALPDPTIDRGSASPEEDSTRLYNKVRAFSAGNKSNPFTHAVVGDGVTNFYPMPWKVADPVLISGGLSIHVRDRFTDEVIPLTVGIEGKNALSGGAGGGGPSTTAATPDIRTATAGQVTAPDTVQMPVGASFIVTSGDANITAKIGDSAPPAPHFSIPTVDSFGAPVTVSLMPYAPAAGDGSGTGGAGPEADALIGIMPGAGTLGVRLARPLTWHQQIEVVHRYHTPQWIELTDEDSIAEFGESSYTLQDRVFQSSSAAMQYAAAMLADFSRPVKRGSFRTNLVNDAEVMDAIGRTVRLVIEEKGFDEDVVVTAMEKEWREGEVLTQRLSFGAPESEYDFVLFVKEQEERIRTLEGADQKTEATA